jgi:hypothetical protein
MSHDPSRTPTFNSVSSQASSKAAHKGMSTPSFGEWLAQGSIPFGLAEGHGATTRSVAARTAPRAASGRG